MRLGSPDSFSIGVWTAPIAPFSGLFWPRKQTLCLPPNQEAKTKSTPPYYLQLNPNSRKIGNKQEIEDLIQHHYNPSQDFATPMPTSTDGVNLLRMCQDS